MANWCMSNTENDILKNKMAARYNVSKICLTKQMKVYFERAFLMINEIDTEHLSELANDTFPESKVSSLKWLYSKQPKLGLTQGFVMDCAHALCVVHTTKRLVSLMLLKGFLSDCFIYFMHMMLDDNFE